MWWTACGPDSITVAQQHPGLDLSSRAHPHCIFTTSKDKDPRHKESGTAEAASAAERGVTKQGTASYPYRGWDPVTQVLCPGCGGESMSPIL